MQPAAKPATLVRSVVLPSALAAGVAVLVGGFLTGFLQDRATIGQTLGVGWVVFTAGRVLGFLDRPRGYGLFLRQVLTGTSLGFIGAAFMRGLFVEGPGWPWTPVWFILGGFGFGLYRSHKALLKKDRGNASWRSDLKALAVLVVGYGLFGLSIFLVFQAFRGFIPGAGKALTLGLAVYALQGARLLLAFAGEDRAARGKGFVGWMKAHALQNAIVVLVLVAYATFRGNLADTLPFFPLAEYGLGIAVFGFVLSRLRSRFRREGALLATASQARAHERVVTELREHDYDAVARPVTRFVESGQGQAEYAEALLTGLPAGDTRAEAVRAEVAKHREPPRAPPLEMAWGFAAGGALTTGLAIAALVLGLRIFEAEMPYPALFALVFVAFGVYAQQDVARAHHRPWLAAGVAAAGASVLLLDFLLFAGATASLADVPGVVWGIVAGVFGLMVGVPVIVGWRQVRRLASGPAVDARRLAPAMEMQAMLQKTRKRAATMMLVAFAILLPVPWLADWLAGRGFIPAEFPAFLDDVLAIALWVVAGLGSSALVRFYGLTRGRPRLVARERARRERRLALHRSLVATLERS